MPVDALIALQALVTKTATFNGAALILNGGTPVYGLWARVLFIGAVSTSTNAATFSIDVCYDGVPTTWRSDFVGDAPLSLTTTAQSGVQYIPFNVHPTVVSGVITAPQIRATVTISGAGTGTVPYQVDIMEARP